jgi:hypothetical protein
MEGKIGIISICVLVELIGLGILIYGIYCMLRDKK